MIKTVLLSFCLILALPALVLAQQAAPRVATQVKVNAVVQGVDVAQLYAGDGKASEGPNVTHLPSVTTKAGIRAVIEMIREFRFPTEFTKEGEPAAFEMAPLGVVIEITPYIKGGKIAYSGVLRLTKATDIKRPHEKGVSPLVEAKTYFHDIVASGESVEFEAVGPDGKPAKLTIAVDALGSNGKAVGK